MKHGHWKPLELIAPPGRRASDRGWPLQYSRAALWRAAMSPCIRPICPGRPAPTCDPAPKEEVSVVWGTFAVGTLYHASNSGPMAPRWGTCRIERPRINQNPPPSPQLAISLLNWLVGRGRALVAVGCTPPADVLVQVPCILGRQLQVRGKPGLPVSELSARLHLPVPSNCTCRVELDAKPSPNN